MQIGWKDVRDNGDGGIQDYMYFGSDGKARIGWYSIEPPEDLDGYDGDVEWFYFSNNGKPKAADSDRLDTQDLTRINGKTYLFNEKGNPVYGLRKVYTAPVRMTGLLLFWKQERELRAEGKDERRGG